MKIFSTGRGASKNYRVSYVVYDNGKAANIMHVYLDTEEERNKLVERLITDGYTDTTKRERTTNERLTKILFCKHKEAMRFGLELIEDDGGFIPYKVRIMDISEFMPVPQATRTTGTADVLEVYNHDEELIALLGYLNN